MGDFVVRVHAVGGHGCQRNVKDREQLAPRCGNPSCPDCLSREFVERLKATGSDVKVATLTHWPGDLPGYGVSAEVKDDLITGKRRGSFD